VRLVRKTLQAQSQRPPRIVLQRELSPASLAQIDGILDKVPAPERLPLLSNIESACRKRADDEALATTAAEYEAQAEAVGCGIYCPELPDLFLPTHVGLKTLLRN
jgi:hypothetical protein